MQHAVRNLIPHAVAGDDEIGKHILIHCIRTMFRLLCGCRKGLMSTGKKTDQHRSRQHIFHPLFQSTHSSHKDIFPPLLNISV